MIDVCGKLFEFSTRKFEECSVDLRNFIVNRVETKSRTMIMNVLLKIVEYSSRTIL
jgi:hypothetical protein